MNFSTLFRLEENLHLDKRTLVILRWIAIAGQLFAINLVHYYLELEFLIVQCHLIIIVGLITNLFLQFRIKINQLKDTYSALFLIYDICQLSVLLYLTGGIANPFSLLLIVPAIVSSTFLSMGTTIILGVITILSLSILTKFYLPLPGVIEYSLNFPIFYLYGMLISIIVGLIFLSYFGIRFSGETKKRSEALNKLQQVIGKEYELESLGGQAAAAAHSLGTPLATITVVAKELRKEIGRESKHSKDLDLLISQTKRCGDILKQISQKQIIEDNFMNEVKLEDLLVEILRSFMEGSDKEIKLKTNDDKNKIKIKRSPEIIFGLRNFIGNAVKFSNKKIEVVIQSNNKIISVQINDDGPGFPEDIINVLGEPYIKSKSKAVNKKSGLGLGTFLGKTLLERQGARLEFCNSSKFGGASVSISWATANLISNL
ncbi:ActS/PrrB/RegB family redox-sensitive histidine kinase [Pelagibacteraceae bacterium]|nr:ActS/PrrB/RegB family redox-sensitive histidine kinase [Pelagibacteraceae bacterium]|tara:strand:+ start:603 stop:1892 length:1290 start_codon:yes stop_codon:yes gene_type:complete